jgi:hypothetical protein
MPSYLLSVAAVARVQRLDGRSKVVAVLKDPGRGWERLPTGLPLTRETLARLREEGVRTVELRRWFRRGRVPLTWFPQGQGAPLRVR